MNAPNTQIDCHKPTALQFSINGLGIHALRWRNDAERDRVPVLCIHGFLDNAASFSRMASAMLAAMPSLDLVAVDLAGHGLSYHRSVDATYNVWEDLEDVLSVADELGWDQFHMLGHSRGGTVALLLSAVLPDRVISQVLLDAFLPVVNRVPFPTQLYRHIRDRKKFSNRRQTVFSSIESAIELRLQINDLLSESEIRPLIERGLVAIEGGFRWRHDSLLHAASAIKLSDRDREEVMAVLKTPTRVIVANNNSMKEYAQSLNESLAMHQAVSVIHHDGGHHFHLQAAHVASISSLTAEWLMQSALAVAP